ncbi:MAG: hypothetical protein SVO01_04950 [Thermotogota bacterium]|nr:hypothetical protein [Thermotogota bacterium]
MKYLFEKSLTVFILFFFFSCAPSIPTPMVKSTLSPSFSPEKYSKVAVYVNGNKQDSLRHVEEEFIRGLMRKHYTVPARSDLALILKEQDFQGSDITDNAAMKLGKLIDVQAFVIVKVSGKEKEVSARMIDVENGEILWIGRTNSGPYFFTKARYLARMIPPAGDISQLFKEKWDYYRAEGVYDETFDWSKTNKVIVQIKGLKSDRRRKKRGLPGNLGERAYRLEGDVIAKLMQNGFRVPSRSDIASIINEHNFNANMLSDKALTQLGKISNARIMLVVWMSKIFKDSDKGAKGIYKYSCVCTIRAIDLEKSNVIWSGSLGAYDWFGYRDNKERLYDDISNRLIESGLIPKKM